MVLFGILGDKLQEAKGFFGHLMQDCIICLTFSSEVIDCPGDVLLHFNSRIIFEHLSFYLDCKILAFFFNVLHI